MGGQAQRSAGHSEADGDFAPASVRLEPTPVPEPLRHPWAGTRDRESEEIAFIHQQLEALRAAMTMPDPEEHRSAAREELRTSVQILTPVPGHIPNEKAPR